MSDFFQQLAPFVQQIQNEQYQGFLNQNGGNVQPPNWNIGLSGGGIGGMMGGLGALVNQQRFYDWFMKHQQQIQSTQGQQQGQPAGLLGILGQ